MLRELMLCISLGPSMLGGREWKGWHHLHLLINEELSKSDSSLAQKLGQSHIPPQSRALSITLCKCLLDCFQEQSLNLPLVHLGVRQSQPTRNRRQGSVVQGGSLTYTVHHALHLQVKTRSFEVLKATQLARAEQGGQRKTYSFFF